MSHCKNIFRLKYEDWGDFLGFYSKSKEMIHKLKKGNLVAVVDDIFLNAYFAILIEAPGPRSEVSIFLKDPTKTYRETLEFIYADYMSQTTGEYIQRVPG